MKQLTLATSAAGLTLTACSYPDDHTLDLTITIQGSEASLGSFNIPLLISDIPDLLSALSDILGPIHSQFLDSTCQDDPDAETEPTANGLGEELLRELDHSAPCKHEFVVLTNESTGQSITKCFHCGMPTNNPL